MKVADISEQGRATQGVKLIRIDDGDEIAAITRIDVQGLPEDIESEILIKGPNATTDESDASTAPDDKL
jgi:DNA gyrase subunit A